MGSEEELVGVGGAGDVGVEPGGAAAVARPKGVFEL